MFRIYDLIQFRNTSLLIKILPWIRTLFFFFAIIDEFQKHIEPHLIHRFFWYELNDILNGLQKVNCQLRSLKPFWGTREELINPATSIYYVSCISMSTHTCMHILDIVNLASQMVYFQNRQSKLSLSYFCSSLTGRGQPKNPSFIAIQGALMGLWRGYCLMKQLYCRVNKYWTTNTPSVSFLVMSSISFQVIS